MQIAIIKDLNMCVIDTKDYIKAVTKPWWSYDEVSSRISVCLEDENGNEYISFEPASFAICGVCEGRGRNDLGICYRCESRRVIPVVDNKEVIEQLLDQASYMQSKEEVHLNELNAGL